MKPRRNVRIVHELSGRLRIRCTAFHQKSFDWIYMEAALENIDGVESVKINIRAGCVVLLYNGSASAKSAIVTCLENIPSESFQPNPIRQKNVNPITLAGVGMLTIATRFLPRPLKGTVSLLLALPILLNGIRTLLSAGIKVETLDGAVVGFSLLRRDFFTSNAVVFLLTLGQYLEQLSEEKATNLLKSLLRPQVDEVWIEKDGLEVSIPVGEMMIGDIVICGLGEIIPVDGSVTWGEALLNQSSITGESIPIHVKIGSEVFSGSVVEEGKIKIKAKQVGGDTGMARISRFLENSLSASSPVQKKSDELADRLAPVTFGLGLGIYALTRDVSRAASVLTVDYSCAIKLANPVAVKASMYTAAHNGVLLRGSAALDSLARVDTIFFDKTGTLTGGTLQVVDVIPFNSCSTEDLLALAAGAEEHYTHPVAKAVVRAAGERGLTLPPMSQVDFIVAHGVSAYVDEKHVLVGSRHFVEYDEHINCSAADRICNDLYQEGKSLLFVACAGTLEGIITLRDELRPESAGVLRELKKSGITNIIILTGDHRKTARALAAELDAVDEVYWELKPEDKAAIIKKMQDRGNRVAFAGDGVNDAPALATADVGICMPGGADLARESAQVVLLHEDLTALVTGRNIALKSQKTIKTGFAATLGFNTLFLILALLGRIQPVTAALLHNLNTVGILGYSTLTGLQRPDTALPRSTNNKTTAEQHRVKSHVDSIEPGPI
ncbi:MAG: heavy metal translocating P-type ATPase [Thermodesulfobacteriota bacterium]|nr:heavy metal translocating P-type ATPase [Thermodesulfobacteriota bacterium]